MSKKTNLYHHLVLGISPSSKGFGFTLFEGTHSLVDWGAVGVQRPKNARSLVKIAALLSFYLPDVVVLENFKGSRRSGRITDLLKDIHNVLKRKKITVHTYSRAQIRDYFSHHGAKNKHEIAVVLSEHYPELKSSLPPKRKLWMSEDYRMAIFDAASLVATYFDDGEE